MNNMVTRTFEDSIAVRSHVPLLQGLMGPSGSGKTFSALRLATGIQRVSGGEIFFIDTESKRALHYADQFKFRHIAFGAPFGSLDYLAALKHCVSKGAGVIIVDSMSHEHGGEGGYLLTQEAELDRMAGDDYEKRDRSKFAAWIKPAKLRQGMINGILQLNCNFVFCFRAKEKTKPVPGKKPLEMGFMPIAGEELLFEMTANCLLLPKAGGVPTWRSDHIGERLMMKLPAQFERLFENNKPLDEETGAALAQWARGNGTKKTTPIDSLAAGNQAAERGLNALEVFWKSLSANERQNIGQAQLESWKRTAGSNGHKTTEAEHRTMLAGDSAEPPHDPETGEIVDPDAGLPTAAEVRGVLKPGTPAIMPGALETQASATDAGVSLSLNAPASKQMTGDEAGRQLADKLEERAVANLLADARAKIKEGPAAFKKWKDRLPDKAFKLVEPHLEVVMLSEATSEGAK